MTEEKHLDFKFILSFVSVGIVSVFIGLNLGQERMMVAMGVISTMTMLSSLIMAESVSHPDTIEAGSWRKAFYFHKNNEVNIYRIETCCLLSITSIHFIFFYSFSYPGSAVWLITKSISIMCTTLALYLVPDNTIVYFKS